MYYGKKKAIIIAIIVIALVIILGAIGVFVLLGSDTFKSPEEMFFKYMGKAIEEFDYKENAQLAGIENLKKEVPYTIKGTIEAKIQSNEEWANKIFNSGINQSKLVIDGKVDEAEAKAYAKSDLFLNNNNIFTIQFARNDDTYAIYCDEIVTAYVGLENNNLKDLARKLNLGINVEEIPDKIEIDDMSEDLFKISEQEKSHILEIYANVIKENVDKKSFTIEKDAKVVKNGSNVKATGYRLNLNGQQVSELEIAMLRALSQDSITLNMISTKAKMLGLNSKYSDVNTISQTISRKIAEIQNAEEYGDGISIVVYVDNNNNIISTECIVNNIAKFTAYTTQNDNTKTRNIIIENLEGDGSFQNIEIVETEKTTAGGSSTGLSINVDDLKTVEFYMNNVGNSSERYLNTEMEVSYADEQGSYEFTYKQELNFVDQLEEEIVKVDKYNSGIINYYPAEQTESIAKQIVARINYLLNEKLSMLGIDLSNGRLEPKLNEVLKEQEIATFNSTFEPYVGTISGTSLKSLITIVNNNNKDVKNKNVILTLDGINTSGSSSVKTDNNKNYTVELVKDDEGYITEIKATTQEMQLTI